MTPQEQREALEALVRVSSKSIPSTALAEGSIDFCSFYHSIREDILKYVIPLLKIIPVYGPLFASIITTLTEILDQVCKKAP
jgi:hypothetical protein